MITDKYVEINSAQFSYVKDENWVRWESRRETTKEGGSERKQVTEVQTEHETEKQKEKNRADGLEWQPQAGMFHFRLTLQLGWAR